MVRGAEQGPSTDVTVFVYGIGQGTTHHGLNMSWAKQTKETEMMRANLVKLQNESHADQSKQKAKKQKNAREEAVMALEAKTRPLGLPGKRDLHVDLAVLLGDKNSKR